MRLDETWFIGLGLLPGRIKATKVQPHASRPRFWSNAPIHLPPIKFHVSARCLLTALFWVLVSWSHHLLFLSYGLIPRPSPWLHYLGDVSYILDDRWYFCWLPCILLSTESIFYTHYLFYHHPVHGTRARERVWIDVWWRLCHDRDLKALRLTKSLGLKLWKIGILSFHLTKTLIIGVPSLVMATWGSWTYLRVRPEEFIWPWSVGHGFLSYLRCFPVMMTTTTMWFTAIISTLYLLALLKQLEQRLVRLLVSRHRGCGSLDPADVNLMLDEVDFVIHQTIRLADPYSVIMMVKGLAAYPSFSLPLYIAMYDRFTLFNLLHDSLVYSPCLAFYLVAIIMSRVPHQLRVCATRLSSLATAMDMGISHRTLMTQLRVQSRLEKMSTHEIGFGFGPLTGISSEFILTVSSPLLGPLSCLIVIWLQ